MRAAILTVGLHGGAATAAQCPVARGNGLRRSQRHCRREKRRAEGAKTSERKDDPEKSISFPSDARCPPRASAAGRAAASAGGHSSRAMPRQPHRGRQRHRGAPPKCNNAKCITKRDGNIVQLIQASTRDAPRSAPGAAPPACQAYNSAPARCGRAPEPRGANGAAGGRGGGGGTMVTLLPCDFCITSALRPKPRGDCAPPAFSPLHCPRIPPPPASRLCKTTPYVARWRPLPAIPARRPQRGKERRARDGKRRQTENGARAAVCASLAMEKSAREPHGRRRCGETRAWERKRAA